MRNMKEIIINVEGMACEGCENRIQNAVNNIDGVDEVIANHKTGIVKIVGKDNISENEIKETIGDIGFEVKEEK